MFLIFGGNILKGQEKILQNRFVKLIEENYLDITERFMNALLKDPETSAYVPIDQNEIYQFTVRLYKDLSKWIGTSFSKEQIKERYLALGVEMNSLNVPFYQVQKAMVLQKRFLWVFVMDKMYEDSTSYKEAIFLNNRVVLYFDRATFYMLKGYAVDSSFNRF